MQTIKCVLVGDGSVGKTCLLASYSQNAFPNGGYVPTVFDTVETIETYEGKSVTLSLWDTAGQSDYDRLRPLSYPGTDVFVLCYAVDSPDSHQNALYRWHPELKHHCPATPIVLVATKLDLRGDPATLEKLREVKQEPVSHQAGSALAKQIKAARFLECSALTRVGMACVFKEVVEIVMNPAAKGKPPRRSSKTAKMCSQS